MTQHISERQAARELAATADIKFATARSRIRRLKSQGLKDVDEGERQRRDGRCEICALQTGKLVSDHSHKHGKHRGWLCGHCNSGLGMFRDDPWLLREAAEYLERHADFVY